MMHNVTLKTSLSQQESVYLIHIPSLPKNGKKISAGFQVLPWRDVTEYLIETPSLNTKELMKTNILITLYVNVYSNVFSQYSFYL